MKTQSYKKGWAFVLTLAMVFTTLFGGFGFLGIKGMVEEVYAATIDSTLDLTATPSQDNISTDGWAWDSATSTLTLSGINLSTASSAGIIVPTDTAIVLVGNNYVESTQASGSSSSGIYAVNGLTISGSGTLTVTGGAINSGSYTYGIYVDRGSTTINSCTVTASGGTASGWNGRSIGIGHTGWTLTINGATVTAVGGTASGDTGYSCGLYGESGNLTMNGGTLNAIGGTATNDGTNYGISYIGSIHFNGGTTTVTTNNATQHGAIFGMSGIYLDTDQWISSPAGVGLNADGNRIVTLSDGTTSATSAIISPYAAPTISVNDPSVTEGNSGTANLVFTVSLSAASVQTVTVSYAAVNGTATAGSDYTSTSGALTFSPGETSKNINVVISGDTTLEPNETIFLNLSGATKATISDSQGIGTITNDDAASIPLASVSISGQAKVGQTLSATVSPSAATVTYQWKAAGTNIASATGAAYTVQASDLSKVITITTTGTGGYSGTVTSTSTSAVTYISITAASITMTAPAAGAAPQITGDVQAATVNSDYTITGVTWNQSMTAGGKFKAGTAYTATIVLTSKNTKEFQSAAFTPTAAGAASVGSTSTTGIGIGNTVSFTVTFDATVTVTVYVWVELSAAVTV